MATYSPTHIARFWSKVSVRGDYECWEWLGARSAGRYGRFKVNGCVIHAHRVAWEIFNAEALGERFACHTCDNKICVNPNHLYAGDRLSNARDAVARGKAPGNGLDQRGENNPNAKLSAGQVHAIMAMIASGASNSAIAAKFPVTDSAIGKIRNGEAWTCLAPAGYAATKEQSAKCPGETQICSPGH